MNTNQQMPLPSWEDERCGDRVSGTVPSWAGEDQISPCRCVRPAGHEGSCECAHEEPADMVPVQPIRTDRTGGQ